MPSVRLHNALHARRSGRPVYRPSDEAFRRAEGEDFRECPEADYLDALRWWPRVEVIFWAAVCALVITLLVLTLRYFGIADLVDWIAG